MPIFPVTVWAGLLQEGFSLVIFGTSHSVGAQAVSVGKSSFASSWRATKAHNG